MTLIEKAANIAVLIVACFVVEGRVNRWLTARNPPPSRKFQETYLGKRLPTPVRGANATLVLFYSKNCHYCSDSAPFYTRLAALRSGGGLALIAEFPQLRETYTDGIDYFTSKGLAPDAVVPASFPDLGVVATPTLALLDKTGVVRKAWSGKLPKEMEDEVFSAIGSLCPACRL